MASLDEAFSGRRMDNNEPIVQLELYQSTDEIVNDITKINAEINFGVTKYDSSVTPQGGGYTRKRKYHRRR